MGSCPHEVLAATLTLFQPGGGADCALHILMSPPSFENHKRTWVDSKLDYLEPSGFLPEGDAQLIKYARGHLDLFSLALDFNGKTAKPLVARSSAYILIH